MLLVLSLIQLPEAYHAVEIDELEMEVTPLPRHLDSTTACNWFAKSFRFGWELEELWDHLYRLGLGGFMHNAILGRSSPVKL